MKFYILFFLKKRFHSHPNMSATFIILTYDRSFCHSQQIIPEDVMGVFGLNLLLLKTENLKLKTKNTVAK